MASNAADPEFKKGERVTIVRGSYKHHKYGTFLRYSGEVSADIKVENDKASERCLRLTSIAPVKWEDAETIVVSKEGFYELIESLEALDIDDDTLIDDMQIIVKRMEQLAGGSIHQSNPTSKRKRKPGSDRK